MPLRHARPTNRTVPAVLRPDHVERLAWLLGQDRLWVQRLKWRRWLEDGSPDLAIPIAELGRGERVAGAAWLRQQQHRLHAALHGAQRAPDGWVESLPLMRVLEQEP